MAERGYWASQFRNGAPEAVAMAWVSQGGNKNEVIHHADKMGPERLVAKSHGSWKKDKLALAVMSELKIVPRVIREIMYSNIPVSGPIISGLQIKDQIRKDDIQAKMWLDKDPDHVIFYGPYSEILESFLMVEIGQILVESDWYKHNIKSIRSAASKYNAVKQVMNS